LVENPVFDVGPLKGLLTSKNSRHRWSDALIRNVSFPASLKYRSENRPFIAAVNRCATQSQSSASDRRPERRQGSDRPLGRTASRAFDCGEWAL